MADQARRGGAGLARRDMLKGAGVAAAGGMMFATGAASAAAKGDMAKIRSAAEAQYDASVKRIQDWIRLPSIAAEDRNMAEGAEYMANLAREAGFGAVEIVPTDGHPGVIGYLDAGAKRTLGIYFMYDVKQFDESEWSSPPLAANIVERPNLGKAIMGRGAVNQKGPEGSFLAALHAMKAAGVKPPVNIALICEGEEEIGSPHFKQIATSPNALPRLKQCEGIYIPFASQSPEGGVTVNLGSKGIIELELVASGEKWGRGPAADIHSSLKAAVDSPVWRLVQALQTLVSPDGNTVAIDGWFENVRPLSAREKALIAESAKAASEEQRKKLLGVKHWIDDLPFEDAIARLVAQPTVNIEGLVAGYTGPGGKTVLPSRAVAKLDLRLVPDQTRAEAEAKLRAHLDRHGFADVETNVSGGYDPTEVAEDSRLVQAALAAYTAMGIETTLFPRLAGSWPGATFTAPPVSIPAGHFGLGFGTGAHAPDEFFVIESTNPNVGGLVDAAMGHVEMMYRIAAAR